MLTMNAYAELAVVFEGDICYVEFDPYPSLDPDVEPGGSMFGLLGDKVQATVANSGNNETPAAPAKVTCQGYIDAMHAWRSIDEAVFDLGHCPGWGPTWCLHPHQAKLDHSMVGSFLLGLPSQAARHAVGYPFPAVA